MYRCRSCLEEIGYVSGAHLTHVAIYMTPGSRANETFGQPIQWNLDPLAYYNWCNTHVDWSALTYWSTE
jgi:hypothetical protein